VTDFQPQRKRLIVEVDQSEPLREQLVAVVSERNGLAGAMTEIQQEMWRMQAKNQELSNVRAGAEGQDKAFTFRAPRRRTRPTRRKRSIAATEQSGQSEPVRHCTA
jgi:hypothetical protein